MVTDNLSDPYFFYLLPELSKLRNPGDVKSLFQKVTMDELQKFNFPKSSEDVITFFSEKDRIIDYLRQLSRKEELTALLSVCWRNNDVYSKLSRFDEKEWLTEKVEINSIFIQDAEGTLKSLFNKHNHKLVDIVNDGELWMNEPYRSWSNHEIKYPVLLAMKFNEDRYKIFDGIHRAIWMVKTGYSQLCLCHPNNTYRSM